MITTPVRVVAPRFGGPEVLRLDELDPPTPGSGEVRLRVLAAGLAYADVLARSGRYPGGPQPPYVPGWDLVGVVEETGPGIETIGPGQRVAALPLQGTHASQVRVPALDLARVPDRLDPAQVACLPLNYLTAHRMLRRANVPADGAILVHGASGGVGTALLDLARQSGVRAVGTASPTKADIVERFGAVPLDRRASDLGRAVRQIVPGGVNASFVGHGGREPARARAATRSDGCLISYGFVTTITDTAVAARAVVQRLRLLGWTILPGPAAIAHRTSHSVRHDPPRRDLQRLVDLLAVGAIDPLVGAQLPLTAASDAHRLMESGTVAGKIVLTG